MKKIRRNEMKKVKGGGQRLSRSLWQCTGEPPFTGPSTPCNFNNPQLVCLDTGTCTYIGECTSPVNQC